MNHRQHVEAFKAKHAPPPDIDEELLEMINDAVKERADNRDNQGERHENSDDSN